VLDRQFCLRVSPWPEITAAIGRRLLQRAHWLAFQVAVSALRRLDDRLLLTMWHFADRWGTVTPAGVKLDVRLPHDTLAAVTGARRPSVSVALKRLIENGQLERQARWVWVLHGPPPAALEPIYRSSRRISERG